MPCIVASSFKVYRPFTGLFSSKKVAAQTPHFWTGLRLIRLTRFLGFFVSSSKCRDAPLRSSRWGRCKTYPYPDIWKGYDFFFFLSCSSCKSCLFILLCAENTLVAKPLCSQVDWSKLRPFLTPPNRSRNVSRWLCRSSIMPARWLFLRQEQAKLKHYRR